MGETEPCDWLLAVTLSECRHVISRFYCGVKRGIASRKIRFHLCYQSFTKLRERGSVEMFCGKCVNGSEVANIVDSLVDGNSLIFPPT